MALPEALLLDVQSQRLAICNNRTSPDPTISTYLREQKKEERKEVWKRRMEINEARVKLLAHSVDLFHFM
jgi:hypothetical protein